MAQKPRLGVFKFASCDGCQLSLLDCEDELLAVVGAIEIGYFLEATRRPLRGKFDLSLVEGSISSPEQLEQIQEVRRRSRFLVTIGACATAGGIQALRNWGHVAEYLQVVYARPEYIKTLATSTPIAEHVPVDFELRGCPINKRQLLEVITAFLAGRRANVPNHAVCVECKRAGTVCVTVAHGVACLGPVTHAGCGALCPGYDRGCYGCYGPSKGPNVASLARHFGQMGVELPVIDRMLHTFNAWAPGFRDAAEVPAGATPGEGGPGR
ncbi:MAG: oxidoreductase [Planctomycetes bacterium]|nr:oxidoreductase [Planctomycetota bacterium]